jgi:flagellar basal-body rod protein FlgF
MSTKGVYTALSGAIAQSQRLDTISNNIANVNTPAFKKDQQLFREYLTANEKPPSVIQVPRIAASVESFYDMQGGDKSFVDANGTYTDFTQGGLKGTNNPLDVAINGKGFFEIATPSGVKLSRNGGFSIDGNGQVVTREGHPVLAAGEPGADPASRVIRLTGQGSLTISESGDIFEGENQVARLSVVDVPNKDSLSKFGNSLYDFKKGFNPEVVNIASPSLKQGFIEASNVNIVQEMTDMITATRTFESTQKAISAYDSMADKLVNVIPKGQ